MDDQRATRLTRELGDDDLAVRIIAARHEVVQAVPLSVARRHLRAIVDEATRLAAVSSVPGPETAHPPSVVAVVPASRLDRASRRSRGRLAARSEPGMHLATATAAAVLAITVGLALTGSLPAVAQELVADTVALIGLDIPRPAPTDPPDGLPTGTVTDPSRHSGSPPPGRTPRDETAGPDRRNDAAERDTTKGRDQTRGTSDRDPPPGQRDRETDRDPPPGQRDRETDPAVPMTEAPSVDTAPGVPTAPHAPPSTGGKPPAEAGSVQPQTPTIDAGQSTAGDADLTTAPDDARTDD